MGVSRSRSALIIVRAFADREVRDATMHDLDENGGTWRYAFEGETFARTRRTR
jgi:hypothetical protein